MREYDPDLPNGYAEACEKYQPDEFEEWSVELIWDLLYHWRDYEKGSPRLKARLPTHAVQKIREETKIDYEEFKARICKAVLENDKAYLRMLQKALDSPTRPKREMIGVRAAIKAFEDLFIDGKRVSRDDWPSKQEVRRRAELILREAGRPLPGERQWPRIFKQAGLSELLSVTYGRGHKKPL
jgi:hypothetical protein